MNDIASDRVGPMQNPLHLGELIREIVSAWQRIGVVD